MAKPAGLGKPGLLPERLVAERYAVTPRTLLAWDEDSDLGFPVPVMIRRRRYRSIEALDQWDKDCARVAVHVRSHNSKAPP